MFSSVWRKIHTLLWKTELLLATESRMIVLDLQPENVILAVWRTRLCVVPDSFSVIICCIQKLWYALVGKKEFWKRQCFKIVVGEMIFFPHWERYIDLTFLSVAVIPTRKTTWAIAKAMHKWRWIWYLMSVNDLKEDKCENVHSTFRRQSVKVSD